MRASVPRSPERQVRRDLVISALALVSVGIGVYDLLRPRFDVRFTLLDAVDLAIVAVFIADFVDEARASGDWKRHVRTHWWELPSMVPLTSGMLEGAEGLSLVRGVRLVRLARVVRLLRVVGVAARFRRVRHTVRRIVARAQLVAIAAFGAAAVLAGALALWLVEGGTNPGVQDAGDALWWSLDVFTTVALSGIVPRTPAGRVVVSLLMVGGVAFIGVFTASLAGAIVKDPGDGP